MSRPLRIMKKRILRLFFPILIFLLSISPCSALLPVVAEEPASQGDYACILEDAFFYATPDENRGVFLLPKTYYVRLLEYGTEFCKIEYQADESIAQRVVGYAKTSTLTFVDYQPERPYLYHTFDVVYQIPDTNALDPSYLTQVTITCAYYGDFKVGSKTYCYVLRGSQFGYVPKPNTLAYEENTEYAEYLENLQASTSAPDQPQSPNISVATSPVQIGILVVLCLLVPFLAALILKPPRRPPYETEE